VVLIGGLNPNNTYYLLTDALGSVVSAINWSAGGASVQGNQLFGPYGKGRYYVGNLTTARGFTGHYNDGLTGLDSFNARYDDPVVGVFLSPDSVQGNASGMNPYGYVGGNPETQTDPSGRAYDWEQGGAGGGGDGGDGAGAGVGGEDDSFTDASTSAIESTGNGFEPAIKVDWQMPEEQVWEENGQTYVTTFDANGNEISIHPVTAPDDLEGVDHGYVNAGETPQDRVEEPNGIDPTSPTHSNVDSPSSETPSAGGAGHEPPGGNRPPVADEPPAEGPGHWEQVNEHMPQRAAQYQAQIVNQPPGQVYVVDGVKFDGYSEGILLEAKGPGYNRFLDANGNFQEWWRGIDSLRNQAENQQRVAGGLPIEWHIAEQEAYNAISRLLQEFNGIQVIYTPMIP